uniref:YeiH family protein n=1 Tax=Thaumasiovibrio occultus TaxID=1891184 RepID=UPI000B34EBCC|nr:putative sulfate exporter family transporter [Thaumasiovibrio occultus]
MNRFPFIFVFAGAICFLPFVNSPIALILGMLVSVFGQRPDHLPIAAWSKKLLSWSIIGLGFGIELKSAFATISNSIGLIFVSIFATLGLGYLGAKLLKMDAKTGHLISSGTAICGGSAIAAVGPAIDAKPPQMSLALTTVFILNAIALFIFPPIGHALNLDQNTFGVWAAIAIHDTSSVVGAASAYGEEALQVATTTKLSRALWIIPVAFISGLMFRSGGKKMAIPTFILWYIAAMIFAYLVPQLSTAYGYIFLGSKQLLVVSLFLIGSTMTAEQFKQAGWRPIALGVGLWGIISVASLLYLTAP